VCRGSENSWKGSSSCHRARRILIRPVFEAQGKGGLEAEQSFGVTVKVYNLGVGQACEG
jgi:hypothetical protein